jgi:hypothetical protein
MDFSIDLSLEFNVDSAYLKDILGVSYIDEAGLMV